LTRLRLAAWIATAALLPAIPGTSARAASSLVFSQYSGDPTPASVLQATLQFQVVGSTLLVEAVNQTAAAAPYDIYWIYFNASSDVRGLSLAGYNDPYWTLYDDGYWVTTPVFGVFDYSLWSYGPSQPQAYIQPGESQSFTLAIDCAPGAVCDASDFTSEISSGGWVSPLAAMRFVWVNVDAAFGASTTALAVPEPRTVVLVALGLAAIAAARRRARPRRAR
jgi:hypothetical protein